MVPDVETVSLVGIETVNSESAVNLMRGSFERAAGRSSYGVSCFYYIFAGDLVQFRIVGRELARRLRRPFVRIESARLTFPQLSGPSTCDRLHFPQ